MKKKFFPYLLSILLITATLGTTVIGYLAYKNLAQIIDTLHRETQPQADLTSLGRIDNHLEKMDHSIDRYVYSGDTTYKSEFFQSLNAVDTELEKLLERNATNDTRIYFDSLKVLVLEKRDILLKVSELDEVSVVQAIANFRDQLDFSQISETSDNSKSQSGLLRGLFGKKGKVDVDNFDSYRAMVNRRLDSFQKNATQQRKESRLSELELRQQHDEVRRKVQAILTQLETRMFHLIKTEGIRAQERAEYMSNYVSLFAIMLPAMLLLTLTVLVLYTARTRKNQAILRKSQENALALANAKEQFLANISHEIRTPINAITGFSKVLLETPLDEKQREQLTIIDKSSNHLVHIINDVLDYSKLKSGYLTLDEKPFDPTETISDSIQLLSHRADEKNIELVSHVDPLPSHVNGDQFRLQQMLLNLVFNAIKFTPSGSVMISVKSQQQSENKININIDVTDTGVGIANDMQQEIFEEFSQVDGEMAAKGTGLGLAITKKLVEKHNGQIKVRSSLGIGSTFSLQLPYEVVHKSETSQESGVSSSLNLDGLSILVADDELFNRKLLTAIFSDHQVQIDEAVNGEETLQLLEDKKYDVVLLDFKMPKVSGPEVVKRVRKKNGPNKNTPIIGITATVSEEELATAKRAGIDRILSKPFDHTILFQMIHEECKVEGATMKEEYEVEFSTKSLNEMGDRAFVNEMIEIFISSSKENLDLMEDHFLGQNWKELGEVYHKILGPTRLLAATNFIDKLKEAEQSLMEGNPISFDSYQEIRTMLLGLMEALSINLNENKINERA